MLFKERFGRKEFIGDNLNSDAMDQVSYLLNYWQWIIDNFGVTFALALGQDHVARHFSK